MEIFQTFAMEWIPLLEEKIKAVKKLNYFNFDIFIFMAESWHVVFLITR